MKKKLAPTLISAILILLILMPATAATPRVIMGKPILHISGTTASCIGKYNSGNQTDKISITLVLKDGNVSIATWNAEGYGSVIISETHPVEKGKTYELVLSSIINGTPHPDVSVVAKCN